MILKLTYVGKNVPTLVNMKNVQDMYRVSDPKGFYPPSTKITYTNERYINVVEDLQTILKLVQEYEQGVYQSTDWVQVDEDVSTPQQRFERSYYGRRERNYNTPKTYNENHF